MVQQQRPNAEPASAAAPWWRLLAVLWSPREVARAAATESRGFGTLFALLAIETMLVQPSAVAGALAKLRFVPVAAVGGLWSLFLNDALAPALSVFVIALVAYYLLRWLGSRTDVWGVASAMAYCWVPHTLWVSVAILLASLGLDHPMLPQHRLLYADLSALARMLKLLLELLPTSVLMLVAFATLRGAAPETVRSSLQPCRSQRRWVPPVVMGAVATLMLAATTVATWGVVSRWDELRPTLPGDALPQFALRGLNGARISSHELRGEVAVIDFWATWCPPCVASMPDLERLHRAYESRGLRLVSVNVEAGEDASVRAFALRQGVTFPIYFDAGELQRRLGITSYPTVFLVDRGGTVRAFHVGTVGYAQLSALIEPLLDRP